MAYGGKRVGSNDPAAIIADSSAIRELEPSELMDYFRQHEGTIGALAVFSSIDPASPKAISKISDRLQHRIPSDDAEVIEVINTLSNNAGFYDGRIQDSIENDPIAIHLYSRKDEVPADARTWRLRRSLIAIAHLSSLVECSGCSETR